MKSVEIEWGELKNSKCIKFIFKGKLKEEDAFETAEIWKQDFTTKITKDEKVIVVCNCLSMKGYDTNARKIWQKSINELKSNISELWVISNNKLIRTAAITMGVMTKFKILTADSEMDICTN